MKVTKRNSRYYKDSNCANDISQLIFIFLLTIIWTSSVESSRRSLRIELAETWQEIPTVECRNNITGGQILNGPVRLSIGLNLSEVVFSGSDNPDYSDPFCQETIPYTEGTSFLDFFNGGDFEFMDEFTVHPGAFPGEASTVTGIKTLIGTNQDNLVKGIRYSFGSVFQGQGYQWFFYTFPGDVTLVRFRGFVDVVSSEDGEPLVLDLTSTTFIRKGNETYFDGAQWPTYNGEFFCFEGNNFRGVWDEVTFTSRNPLPGCALENVGVNQPQKPEIDPQKVAAVTVAATSVLLSEDCSDFSELGNGSAVIRDWTLSDRKSREPDRNRAFSDYYRLEITSVSQATISLSSGVDTYLYLRRGCNLRAGLVDSNDDIEIGNFNSQIVNTLPIGSYLIEATTFNSGDTGSYGLTVQLAN